MTGIPAYAVTPTPAVTPGTISKGTPWREVLGLLGPATENQGIPSLEPDDHPSGLGVLEQERIDLILVERAMPARFAGTDPDCMGMCQVQQPGTGQMIVNHHIGVG